MVMRNLFCICVVSTLTLAPICGNDGAISTPKTNSQRQTLGEGVDLDLQFEVENVDLSDVPVFSAEAVHFSTSSIELSKLSPHEGFRLLAQKGTSDASGESEEKYLFGRIKGELYSIDEFELLTTKATDTSVHAIVLYTRRSSDSFTPGPGRAYFKVRLPRAVTDFKIQFIQRDEKFQPLSDFKLRDRVE